jgi:hypothetical protein
MQTEAIALASPPETEVRRTGFFPPIDHFASLLSHVWKTAKDGAPLSQAALDRTAESGCPYVSTQENAARWERR